METHERRSPTRLDQKERIPILLEEYRALNALLLFRLTALDRRLPVSAGFLAVSVGSIVVLPPKIQAAVLLVTPIAIVWLVQTTNRHAQSKEDHIRRIDEIERAVNSLAGEDLMVFQSQHPNRRQSPGGRSGLSSVITTSLSAIAVMFVCLFLGWDLNLLPRWAYLGYVGVLIAFILWDSRQFLRYRYAKPIHY